MLSERVFIGILNSSDDPGLHALTTQIAREIEDREKEILRI